MIMRCIFNIKTIAYKLFKRYFLWVLLLLPFLGYYNCFAQECGTTEYMEHLINQHPEVEHNLKQIEEHTENFIANHASKTTTSVITIPVVVHVVYNSNEQNISAAQINSQIRILNEDYRRLNSDANNKWPQAADVKIEFCLAKIDPNGNPTTGITRTSTTKLRFSAFLDDIKFNSTGGKDAWSRDDYLNIWVGRLSGSVLGYAQFPGGPAETDGVVIDYQYFGNIGTATYPFDLGRTATHEVGHWLNLHHIWGDGGCGATDHVHDTPDANRAAYGCQLGRVTCGTEDMVDNYMDYGDDRCLVLFTQGQGDRMHALFTPGGGRYDITLSTKCGIENNTCYDGIQNGNETGIDCGGPDCDTCATGDCYKPLGLSSYPENNGSGAILSWQAVPGANNYNIGYKKHDLAFYRDTITKDTLWRIKNLVQGETYDWYVYTYCTDSATQASHQSFVAGRSTIEGNKLLVLYPNPSNGNITLEFNNDFAGISYVDIFSITGQLLMRSEENLVLGDIQLKMDLSRYNAGTYILRLTNGSSTKTFKLILY